MRRTIASLFAVSVALVAALSSTGAEAVAPPERYLEPGFTVDVTRDILFGQSVDEHGETLDLLLDVFEPTGDVLAERPTIVLLYGGGFIFGERADVEEYARTLTELGYVVVTSMYRVRENPTTDFLGAIDDAGHDMQQAIRWLRANAGTYRIDPDRIASMGLSAGAITSLYAALLPEATVDGPNGRFSADVAAGVSMAGFFFLEAVDPWSPPVFMAHGVDDTTVPYAWAVPLCPEMELQGNVCEFHSYPAAHMDLADHVPDITTKLLPFLYDHLVVAGDRCGDAFEDVAGDHAFCGEIEWAAHRGLAGGWPDRTFRPTVTVSRQAAAAWLHRAEGADPGPFPDPGFPDVNSTHPFLVPISWAVDGELLDGYLDGTFRPTAPLSRQAAAALLHRDAGSPPGPFPDPGLADVGPDHPFFTEIAWMIDTGLSTVAAGGDFRPGAPVSRQAMVAWLERR